MYLAFAVDRCSDFVNAFTRWAPSNEKVMNRDKQAIAMTWDFPEAAILDQTVGGFEPAVKYIADCMETLPRDKPHGYAVQRSAMESGDLCRNRVVSMDPPYYAQIGYADLSDSFYLWLRHALRRYFPDLFGTLAVPKTEELIAAPHRHRDAAEAEEFWLTGMKRTISALGKQIHPAKPLTIYYASKQTKRPHEKRTAWEVFLAAMVECGFEITGTWPLRTEQEYRAVGRGTNALASSVVLACRPRPENRGRATRGDFVEALKRELPPALADLQKAGIPPVDLAQAAIGPGMAVFTRYSGVSHSSGEEMTVGEALALINEVLDETLEEQGGEFDGGTRWALAWFRQHHFNESDFGVADMLAKAKDTRVEELVAAGIVRAGRGRVRLLRPEELPEDWDPSTDRRLTVWKTVHHLVRALDGQGETAASRLLRKIGGQAETARALAHLLYAVCDRQKRPADARPYNALVRSWPEIARLAREEQGGRRTLL